MSSATPSELNALRAQAKGLTPRAARFALLLPPMGRMPDAWHAALHRDLETRATEGAPLLPALAAAILDCAHLPPDALPRWLREDPDHAPARRLIIDVWMQGEQHRARTMPRA